MLIELQHPFSLNWTKGYLVTNPENRSRGDRTTVSYARYPHVCSFGIYSCT